MFWKIAAPLTEMLENIRLFIWVNDDTSAFFKHCTRLANALILIYSDFSVPCLLDFDAVNKGFGAVLSALSKDSFKNLIADFNRTLNKQ